MKPVTLLAGFLLLVVGCAHREDNMHVESVPSVPVTATAAQREADDREVIAVENQPPAQQPAIAARPRLSQTITLGEQQYAPPPVAAAQPQQGGPSVIVNNYNVQQTAPPVYGYGGYYGGGNGFYGNRATTFYDGRGGSRGAAPQWGSSGWEGARRTAAPGQTPAVGGNWSPVPSYGPAQMK